MQTRLKLRTRSTAEAIVGAVTGNVAHPGRLILGLPDPDRGWTIAGTTTPLTAGQQRQVSVHLQPPAGPHPWPADLPARRLGAFTSARDRRVTVTLVEPTLVVEIHADTAFEYGRWRHLTRLVRVRPDLDVRDVARPALRR